MLTITLSVSGLVGGSGKHGVVMATFYRELTSRKPAYQKEKIN